MKLNKGGNKHWKEPEPSVIPSMWCAKLRLHRRRPGRDGIVTCLRGARDAGLSWGPAGPGGLGAQLRESGWAGCDAGRPVAHRVLFPLVSV